MRSAGWSQWLPSLTSSNPYTLPAAYRHGVAVSMLNGEGAIQGSGVGTPFHASVSGAGELIERRCLFSSIRPHGRGHVRDGGNPTLAEKLVRAIAQLTDESETRISEHEFLLTKGRSLANHADTMFYPTCLLSLASTGLEEDRRLVPFIDSSGSCLHQTPEQALEGAIDELLERQMLLAVWFGSPMDEVCIRTSDLGIQVADREALRAHGWSSQGFDVVTRLVRNGTLRLFTASPPFGRHYCLVLFQGHDQAVRYSVGSSCAESPAKALKKSLIELWHGVIYQHAHAGKDVREAIDILKAGFRAGNTPETVSRFLPWRRATKKTDIEQFLNRPAVAIDVTLRRINEFSSDIFVFERREDRYTFCRVASPDFYVHFNPGVPLNFLNPFAALMGTTQVHPEQRQQLPFP